MPKNGFDFAVSPEGSKLAILKDGDFRFAPRKGLERPASTTAKSAAGESTAGKSSAAPA
jgi:hypothetical protein